MDTLFALGRGQRELIIGDRAIGKTTIGIDTIINQKTSDMICVYIAVGQKSSSVRRAIESIHGHAAVDRCIIVVAEAASSPGLQWIAPFAGFTMAEYFRDRGQHALVVIDDLTKHAATHREIALLTRQSPGREAYPGDVFYVHARLLERAAKLSKEKGGGSLTALPIAETDAGNLSAYIPTNLISITDGQIVLDAKLFHEGQKPAVDVGTSVSRVGGKTQAHALRDAAETVRLDYAQFLELETFTRFGGMPDTRVRDQLARGARIRGILDQARHAPVRLADEVALVLAVQSGLLDALPLPAVARFRQGLSGMLDQQAVNSVKSIQATGTLDGELKPSTSEYAKRICPLGRGSGNRRDSRVGRRQRNRQEIGSESSTDRERRPPGRYSVTERLADISARVEGVRQLGAVVNAMRGIAAARVQQTRAQIVAVDAYAATIADAIGRALALVPPVPPADTRQSSRLALVLFCAEQGFAGAFSERVLEAAGADLTRSEVFLIGTRGASVASGRGVTVNWKSALPSHSQGIPKLADRIAEALYPRIATGEIGRLDMIVSEWRASHGTRVERRRLFPLDMTRFPSPAIAAAPLLNLAPDMLLNDLTADYLHALLCNAALHAFAAENEARMEAMAAAHTQIEHQLSALQSTRRHVRQEEITAEIIELAAGETANQGRFQPRSE